MPEGQPFDGGGSGDSCEFDGILQLADNVTYTPPSTMRQSTVFNGAKAIHAHQDIYSERHIEAKKDLSAWHWINHNGRRVH